MDPSTPSVYWNQPYPPNAFPWGFVIFCGSIAFVVVLICLTYQAIERKEEYQDRRDDYQAECDDNSSAIGDEHLAPYKRHFGTVADFFGCAIYSYEMWYNSTFDRIPNLYPLLQHRIPNGYGTGILSAFVWLYWVLVTIAYAIVVIGLCVIWLIPVAVLATLTMLGGIWAVVYELGTDYLNKGKA